MFAMYDDDGLNFRNTIDHLYDVHEISPTRRIKNDLRTNSDSSKFQSLYKGNIDEEARNKYKQVANMNTRTEIYHVEQIMTHKPIIINDNVSLQECYDIMKDNEIRQLLIRSDKRNTLKGLVTKNILLDYIMNHIGIENIGQTEVSVICEKNIITTDPITDIRRAAKVMIDFNRNAIPVVNEREDILGVVTRHDIVNAVSSIPELQIWA
jgi:acetoin utilization protein AcuB